MNLAELAKVAMYEESDIGMVEIVVLKWKCPDEEVRCAASIIRHTDWPFKLTLYDNRPNTPNTARIWNKLIHESTCDYVCLLDSDAFVQPSTPCWLTRMMSTFREYPESRVVLPVTNRCSTPAQKAPRATNGEPFRHDGEWSGFCFLLRKRLLDEVGPFDEEFVGYGQDSEFSVRLARNGGGTYVRPDVWIDHVHGASFKVATREGYDANADRAYAQELYLRKISA